MSKERELIKDMKSLLGCIYMHQADVLIGRAIEILAEPEQEPSTDDYMYNKLKEDYDFLLNQIPPKQEPLSDEDIWQALVKEEVPDYKATMFIRGIKFAEKAHGIGADDE